MPLADHEEKNRAVWTKWSEGYQAPGRRSWETDVITWGIWSVPESEIGALPPLRGLDTIEFGCGTAYFSAWLAKHGAKPVGIDITPAQLANARAFQEEFGISFPLIEGSAEAVPLADASFDLVLSEYGASIWCDTTKWVPEAARLLRPGGTLVFLRNSTLSMLCVPDVGVPDERLLRDLFGMHRLDWSDGSVNFHLPLGEMFRLLRDCGFEVRDIIEIQPPEEVRQTRFEYMTWEWARRWPSEEIWVAVKR